MKKTHPKCGSGSTFHAPWGSWVNANRRAIALSRRALAIQAGMDPGYITLIERDGQVPSRGFVASLGTVLGARDEALVMAGYIPESMSREWLVSILRGVGKAESKRTARGARLSA